MSEELLRLENLSIDYKVKGGYLSAVNDVNLSVHRGEILAVVGESGCGKSTIAHAIMNLLPGGNEEIEGKIIFKGEDLRTYSRRQMEAIRGKNIGMIFQNPLDSLNPVYKTGKQVEETLPPDEFFRCNSGYFVNLQRVTGLDGFTVFLGDTELLVSHSRKKAFVETLHTYFTQKRA